MPDRYGALGRPSGVAHSLAWLMNPRMLKQVPGFLFSQQLLALWNVNNCSHGLGIKSCDIHTAHVSYYPDREVCRAERPYRLVVFRSIDKAERRSGAISVLSRHRNTTSRGCWGSSSFWWDGSSSDAFSLGWSLGGSSFIVELFLSGQPLCFVRGGPQ